MKKKLTWEMLGLMRIISTRAVMRSQLMAKRLHLNTTDLETIDMLMQLKKTTTGTIARETGLTTGAVTGVVDRLEKEGYVKRESDPGDRRKVLVSLNLEKVTARIMPLYNTPSAAVEEIAHHYSRKELEVIVDFLKRSLQVLESNMRTLASVEAL